MIRHSFFLSKIFVWQERIAGLLQERLPRVGDNLAGGHERDEPRGGRGRKDHRSPDVWIRVNVGTACR